MIIAQDTPRYSDVVKHEDEPSLAITRELVVVNDAAKTLTVGMLLGKVFLTGKYKESVQTAIDGSGDPVAVVVGKDLHNLSVAVPATTDTKVLAIVRGEAIVRKTGLKPHSSFNDATKLAAAYASLATKGILASDSI